MFVCFFSGVNFFYFFLSGKQAAVNNFVFRFCFRYGPGDARVKATMAKLEEVSFCCCSFSHAGVFFFIVSKSTALLDRFCVPVIAYAPPTHT